MAESTVKIMLVDDSEPDNYFHKLVIKETGLNVEVEDCVEAAEALERLKKAVTGERELPDLILLDINMPAVDGWQFLESYRDIIDSRDSRPVIVMLSNSANPADRERAESIDAVSGYCSKPLTSDDVHQLLSAHRL